MTSLENKKILVLGASGMLGSAVVQYLKYHTRHYVVECSYRFPSEEFDEFMRIHFYSSHFVINCIGAIPQKTKDFSVNFQLPYKLVEMCRLYSDMPPPKIIHPTTDCEFLGDSPSLYTVDSPPDAISDYGCSKIAGHEIIKRSGIGKVIRTSIVGLSNNDNASLLGWAKSELENDHLIAGFENHYWNGVTVLEWAIVAAYMIDHYEEIPNLIQIGVEPMSKYDLLILFQKIFELDGYVCPQEHIDSINRCLLLNYIEVPPMEYQLLRYRKFFESEGRNILVE